MLTLFGRIMGVIPGAKGKTGKRETALFWSLMALGLTVIAFIQGPDMVTAGTALLMAIWGFAAALVAAALGLHWSEVSGFMGGFSGRAHKPGRDAPADDDGAPPVPPFRDPDEG